MTSPVTFWTVPRERALARHAEANREHADLYNQLADVLEKHGAPCVPDSSERLRDHAAECLAIAERCERQIGGA